MDRSGDWLRQAEFDLAKVASDMQAGFYEWACFAAHQASEKALKAVFQRLHAQGWGHSLVQLVQSLPPTHSAPTDILEAARRLDHYYIPTRYPDGFPAGSPHDFFSESQAREAQQDAGRVLEFCRGHLS